MREWEKARITDRLLPGVTAGRPHIQVFLKLYWLMPAVPSFYSLACPSLMGTYIWPS